MQNSRGVQKHANFGGGSGYFTDEEASAGEWWMGEGERNASADLIAGVAGLPYATLGLGPIAMFGARQLVPSGSAPYAAPSYLADSIKDGGVALCNDVVRQGAQTWGFANPRDIICDSGIHHTNNISCDGEGNFDLRPENWAALSEVIIAKGFDGQTPGMQGADYYQIYLAAFQEGCNAVESNNGSGDNNYTVNTVNDDGTISEKRFEGKSKNETTLAYTGADLQVHQNTCEYIASQVNQHAQAYKDWLDKNPWFIGSSEQQNQENSGDNSGSTDGDEDEKSSCIVDGVGWIVCAVATWVSDLVDALYTNVIEQMLATPPISMDTSSENGTYNGWKVFRNIANVAFVISFLIIIYSQITSAGVSNYGIKKMLPRLIIAAILVNVSYFLCALIVDVSNIFGNGLYNIMMGIRDQMSVKISQSWATIIPALLGGYAITVGAGAATIVAGSAVIASGASTALIALAVPMVLAALLAVLVAVFALVARQALIIILVMAAPLAFVAMLLPNTEKWFTKWRQMFLSLLLMYPIIALIFAGAQIAGLAILSTVGTSGDPVTTGVAILSGQLVMVLPLVFIFPLITKFSGGGIDKIAGNIKARGQRLTGGLSNRSRDFGRKGLSRGFNRTKGGLEHTATYNKRGRETLWSRTRGATASVGNIAGGIGRKIEGLQDSSAMEDQELSNARRKRQVERVAGNEALAAKIAGSAAGGESLQMKLQASLEADQLKEALQGLAREIATEKSRPRGANEAAFNQDDFLRDRAKDTSRSGSDRAAAVHQAASLGRDGVLRDLAQDSSVDQRTVQEAISSNAGSLAKKAPDLVKGEDAAFGNVTGEELTGFSAKTTQQYMEYLKNKNDNDAAVKSFIGAVEDIRNDSTLQGKFGSDSGAVLSRAARDLPPGAGVAIVHNVDSSSNKIR
ncbi:hypothetical protein [Pseudoclavibacter sp. CFCC 11306]|uniref:hypothetical protein n=1 Tax=Pseudoclavibacter sp. CFCC 11306 TaxID=1564493 RepID=UPI00178873A8|nr:hypothetical protein [Pseudoclavibacter sp. CFCC 11306]